MPLISIIVVAGIRIPSPAGKSLSQGDVSAVIGSSGEDTWAVISSPTVAELEKKMQLNETGWSTMKDVRRKRTDFVTQYHQLLLIGSSIQSHQRSRTKGFLSIINSRQASWKRRLETNRANCRLVQMKDSF